MKRPHISSNESNARGAVTRHIESAGSLLDQAEAFKSSRAALPLIFWGLAIRETKGRMVRYRISLGRDFRLVESETLAAAMRLSR